jgi:hypothetical protein
MFLGYARISTSEQDLSLQFDALTEAGCNRFFGNSVGRPSRSPTARLRPWSICATAIRWWFGDSIASRGR